MKNFLAAALGLCAFGVVLSVIIYSAGPTTNKPAPNEMCLTISSSSLGGTVYTAPKGQTVMPGLFGSHGNDKIQTKDEQGNIYCYALYKSGKLEYILKSSN